MKALALAFAVMLAGCVVHRPVHELPHERPHLTVVVCIFASCKQIGPDHAQEDEEPE